MNIKELINLAEETTDFITGNDGENYNTPDFNNALMNMIKAFELGVDSKSFCKKTKTPFSNWVKENCNNISFTYIYKGEIIPIKHLYNIYELSLK